MQSLVETLFRPEDAGLPAFADAEASLTRGEFAAAVANFARRLADLPPVAGLLMPNGVRWAVAAVAAAVAGKTLVPLPTFFTDAQVAHVLADAGVGFLITDSPVHAAGALPTIAVTVDRSPLAEPTIRPGFGVVTYTSGSTGAPKGVRLGGRQIAWSARALAFASKATSRDRNLSLLPLSLLLEMISAVFVPLVVSGSTVFDREMADAVGRGAVRSIAGAFQRAQPTTAVLVPQLLKIWTAELAATGGMAPMSLRFVAVGGAPVPATLAEAAIGRGIPVHEGYGLSECCSVVALNQPGHRAPGTVGQPLPGLSVTLDDGEIVVAGPSVTDGYLGRSDHDGPWRTGDLGRFDAAGNITVLGRKDNLIVTGYGRNVSPEWVETTLLSDPRLMLACVSLPSDGRLTALLIPAPGADQSVLGLASSGLAELTASLCSALPTYARPQRTLAMSLAEARANGLITDNGRIRRRAIASFLAASTSDAA